MALQERKKTRKSLKIKKEKIQVVRPCSQLEIYMNALLNMNLEMMLGQDLLLFTSLGLYVETPRQTIPGNDSILEDPFLS